MTTTPSQVNASLLSGKTIQIPSGNGRHVIFSDGDRVFGAPIGHLMAANSSEAGVIHTGGLVVHTSGMSVDVVPTTFSVDGVQYSRPQSSITLTGSHATLPRYDVIYVKDGATGSRTGTPAATPVKPLLDDETEVELCTVYVPAQASTPTMSEVTVYADNAEWTSDASSGSIDPDSTSGPHTGSKCIETTAAALGDYVNLSAGDDINISGNSVLSLRLKLKAAWDAGSRIRLEFRRDGARVGRVVEIEAGRHFTETNASSWQLVAVPVSDFRLTGALVDSLRITIRPTTETATDCRIDQIVLQSGFSPSMSGGSFGKIQGDTGSFEADGPDSLLYFVGVSGASVSISGNTVSIAGGATGGLTTDDIGTDEGDIALLGVNGKFTASLLPDSVVGALQYQGSWNAATDTPSIPAADAGNKGHYYVVGTSGNTEIDGYANWLPGDWLASNGDSWDKIDNTDPTTIAEISGLQSALNDKSDTDHTHTVAASGVDGFMGGNDKAHLNNATSLATPNTLMERDANGDVSLRNLTAHQGTFSKRLHGGDQNLAIAGGAVTFDPTQGISFYIPANANFTLNAPASGANWQRVVLAIKQDGVGSRVMTLGTNIRLGADIDAVTLSTAADTTDYLTLIWHVIDSTWDVVAFVKGYNG